MDKYGPKFSKVLLTPDPHYIPGYTGYCPQLKYSFAKSYGRLTGELLTSPEVKHSCSLVLHSGQLPFTHTDADLTLSGIPDSNLKRVIPGYTGFIPKSRNFFGCNYYETFRKAQCESYQEQQERRRRRASSLPGVGGFNSQQVERPKPPLVSISDDVFTYKPLKSFAPLGKPYAMEDENPHKYFISGFTGHVPKARFLIGKGYPVTTNEALIRFRKQQSYLTDPDWRNRPSSSSMPSIHPSNRSLAPSFTGLSSGLDKNTLFTERSS
ncbi:ciliary microtubule inner protein 2B [Salarias fasciatus]|uniref:ciliary microtubule inner protein 2B n=1 Tax=Salarias fasciatus TaxID=181472 RepID=UPI001176B74C|nr:protein FAM166B-like [Salarias fasciatus]